MEICKNNNCSQNPWASKFVNFELCFHSLQMNYGFHFCVFTGYRNPRKGGPLCLLFPVASIGLFSLCLFVLSYSDLFFLIMFYFIHAPFVPLCFLRTHKGLDPDGKWGGEELGGGEGGKAVIRTSVWKKLFSETKQNKKKG